MYAWPCECPDIVRLDFNVIVTNNILSHIVLLFGARLTSNILSGSGVQQQSNNQAVQTQDFGENQDQKHTDEQSWLLGVTSDTSVTDDTNGKTSSQTGQTDGQTCTQLDEPGIQGLGLLQGVSDQDRHDQTVNGDNTSQNDRNDTLEQQVWSQDTGGTHTDT